MKDPWTFEELKALIPKIEAEMTRQEEEIGHEVKPLPPMTQDECMEMFVRLMDAAHARPLNKQECFLHGQLMSAYRQAVMAEMLGKDKNERYIVVSETQLSQMKGMLGAG